LSRAGYRCGLFGKLHLGPAFQGMTEPRGDDGFEVYEWAHDPFHGSPNNAYHQWLRTNHPQLWEEAKRDLVTPEQGDFNHSLTAFDRMPKEGHYSTWVTERAQEFITGGDERPFFAL